MNITVENLAPCRKLLRVELDAKSVDEAFEAVTKDFQKQAVLPGFRPGKAPRDLVIKKHGAEIKEEAKRKLIGVMVSRYSADGEERTLVDILSRVAQSLARIVMGGHEMLWVPEVTAGSERAVD